MAGPRVDDLRVSEQGQSRVAQAGWPAAPGTPSAPDASSPWTGRTEIDPGASQAAWFRAAMMADEVELAHLLVVAEVSDAATAPEGPQTDPHRSAALAEALVLLGRADEATGTLHGAGVRPPGAGEPISWAQAVLGAARAAGGDRGRLGLAHRAHRRRRTRAAPAPDPTRRGRPQTSAASRRSPTRRGPGCPSSPVPMPSARLAGRTALAAIVRRNREAAPA